MKCKHQRSIMIGLTVLMLGGVLVYPAREIGRRAGFSVAAETTKDGWKYSISNDAVTITGFTQDVMGDVVIPSEIEGKPVTAIDDYFNNNSYTDYITSIVVPASVTKIGPYAFNTMKSLSSVKFEGKLLILDTGQFQDDTSLETVEMPQGLLQIKSGVFENCTILKSIKLPETLTVLADNAFCNCAELEEVTIPAKVSEIAYNAFKDCKKLKKVTITDGVKTVSSAAFGNCDSLTEIVFPASVTKVKEPFRYNSNDCDNLISVTFENAACEISSVYGAADRMVTLRGYTNSTAQKYVEDYGKERYVQFELIEVPQLETTTVTTTTALETTTLSETTVSTAPPATTVTSSTTAKPTTTVTTSTTAKATTTVVTTTAAKEEDLSKYWKYSVKDDHVVITGFTSLLTGDIVIPSVIEGKPVTEIDDYFNNNSYTDYITSIVIPASVTKIGPYAFNTMKSLTSVKFEGKLLILDTGMFEDDASLETVEMPQGLLQIKSSAFGNCTSLKSIKLPDTMTVLADNAFCNCAELEEVTIPAKVSEIAYNAFKDCKKLKKVTITDGVKTVSSAAFGNCDSLTEIVFPASVTKVKEPFRYNSNDCDNLISVTFENAACEISSVYGAADRMVTLYGYANSTAQKYAEDFGEERFVKFALIGTAPADNTKDTGLFCDANGNGEIDVADAQFVLLYYVEKMAGKEPSWYELTKNPKAPDAP